MARRHEIVYALNAGGVDKEALSRIDLEKLRLAGEHPVKNWLPRVLGPMTLRPGLQNLSSVAASSRMVEFIRDTDTTALLVFGNETVTIYRDGSPVQVVNSSSTIVNPTFSAAVGGGWTDVSDTGAGTDGVAGLGASGTAEFIATRYRAAALEQSLAIAAPDQANAHTLRITVERGPVFFRVGTSSNGEQLISEQLLLTGVHKLTFTPNAATIYIRFRSEDPVARYVSDCRFEHTALGGAGNLTLPTPWATARLPYLAWDQSNDVMFIADGTVQPRRIERRGNTSWSITKYQTRNGPLQLPSTDKITLAGSAVVLNGNLTSNIPYFKSSHVGCLFELTHNRSYVLEELTAAEQATRYVTVRGLWSSSTTFDDRNLTIELDFTTGSFVGTIVLERSTDPLAEVWSIVDSYTATLGATNYNDEQSNLLVHYRWRVQSYTSGYAFAKLDYAAGSTTGLVRVTSFSSSTQVGYEVVTPLASTMATPDWRGPVWSDDLGWPRVPRFFDGRLWWFRDDRAYGSITDDYDNYDDNVEGDSGPVLRSVGSKAAGAARWALDMQRLIVGTSDSEQSIRSSSFDEPITPTAFTSRNASNLGCSFVAPCKVDRGAIFAQRSNRRLYELLFSPETNDYTSQDVSRLVPNAFAAGIVDMAVQRQPDTRVYIVLGDGTCVVLTYERDDKVVAFTTFEAAGSGLIEDVAVLPNSDQDDVYFIVNRGGTRYLERLAKEADQRSVSTCALLDAHKVLTGSISSITGGTHLASQTVHVWADGVYRGTKTLNGSGAVSLGATYSRVVYGLSYDAEWLSVKLAYAAQLGAAVGQTKSVRRANLILSNSCLDGLRIGKDSSNTDPMPSYVNGTERTTSQFFTHHDHDLFPIQSEWGVDSRIYVKTSSYAGPVTVQAIALDIETRDGAPRGQ